MSVVPVQNIFVYMSASIPEARDVSHLKILFTGQNVRVILTFFISHFVCLQIIVDDEEDIS